MKAKLAKLKLCFKNLTFEIVLKEALTEELLFFHVNSSEAWPLTSKGKGFGLSIYNVVQIFN